MHELKGLAKPQVQEFPRLVVLATRLLPVPQRKQHCVGPATPMSWPDTCCHPAATYRGRETTAWTSLLLPTHCPLSARGRLGSLRVRVWLGSVQASSWTSVYSAAHLCIRIRKNQMGHNDGITGGVWQECFREFILGWKEVGWGGGCLCDFLADP